MTNSQKAASTILNEPKKVQIGKKIITTKPITIATFIKVSELVSMLPQSKDKNPETMEDVLAFVLLEARKYGNLGMILATLALGEPRKRSWWQRRRINELAEYITHELPAVQLNPLFQELLDGIAVQHFFGFTASLSELNLLKEKRKKGQSGE